jgi:RHS repeat-associated protein
VDPFRFSTKFCDDETGLYYYGHRYYHPHTGRWLNQDPLGEPGFEVLRGRRPSPLAGGPNRYLFVGNNPIRFVDPYGLDYGDWWDLRTWFNSGFTESWYDSANSIGQALGGALAGDWNQIEDAYDSGIFGQTQDAGPVPYYGTRAAVGVATVCATAAAAVGTYEFVALGNQSIMVEGVLGGGRMGSGGILQLRVPGQPPIIRFDFHPIPGSGGVPRPHIDSPLLGWHHWPW